MTTAVGARSGTLPESVRSPDEPDVVVIGTGPVGITLCTYLASRGIRVEGIDAEADVYALPRAIGLDHEVLRLFQNIGVAEALAPAIGEFRPSEYRSATGVLLRRLESPPEPYPLAWPPYVTFLQPELERALRRHAVGLSTLTLRTRRTVVGLHDPARPVLTVEDRDTGERTLRRPRFVVACDGANSFTRRSLGIGLEDLDFEEPWLVVDMIVDEAKVQLPETNVQYCNPARPHTYVRGPGTLRRWEFMLLPGEDPAVVNQPEAIWALLTPWLRPDQAQIWRSATYRFHALVAERWREANVFLAGDACHQTPPFLAQGMVQGIKDVANLGWKIVEALREGRDHLLDTYESERKPFVKEVIGVTKRLGEVICELDPDKARKRDATMVAAMAAGQGVQIRQNLFPPLRDGLIGGGGEPRPGFGEPCPQPWIATAAGRQRLDEVIGGGWRLLLTGGMGIPAAILREAEAIGLGVHRIERAPTSGDALVEENGVLADWLAAKGGRCAIVRPDHITFAVAGDATELGAAIRELGTMLAAPLQ